MQKVSYMGDGSTTEFSFNFPYFENTNIIVKKNGASATGYSVVGTSAGDDADIPYTGGKVVFENAPTNLDNITIARSLPLTRVADYQPTELIEPTTLNQDLNYLMEILKDLQDEFDELHTQYTEIADKESTTALLAQISTIHDEIVAVSAQITAMGDISTIRSSITTLDGRTTGLIDYVIASQAPSADNNYTWYRKYKSGWVEQGGIGTSASSSNQWNSITVTFPIQMKDKNYVALGTAYGMDSVSTLLVCIGGINGDNTDNGTGKTTTDMFIQTERLYSGGPARVSRVQWMVSGMAA